MCLVWEVVMRINDDTIWTYLFSVSMIILLSLFAFSSYMAKIDMDKQKECVNKNADALNYVTECSYKQSYCQCMRNARRIFCQQLEKSGGDK